MSPIDTIGHLILGKYFLKDTTLRIGTIQDGKLRIGQVLLEVQFAYLSTHDLAFFHIAVGLGNQDGLSDLILTEDSLGYLLLVVFYQAVSCSNNSLRGTIVLFQLEETRIVVLAREL